MTKGATTAGSGGDPDPQNLDGPPQLFWWRVWLRRYVKDCSPRNWVYHPYFVLYSNLDQKIGPPTLKTWLRPWLYDTSQQHIDGDFCSLHIAVNIMYKLCVVFTARRNARIASAVLATAIPSVCLSVCHNVLCQNDGT